MKLKTMSWVNHIPNATQAPCPHLEDLKDPINQLHFNDPVRQSSKLHFEGWRTCDEILQRIRDE